ncbi:hypothetical protein FZM84_09030, partial [Enterococcus faecium]|nr:hypothetical protein [Enterococcus faecium]
NLSQNVVHSDSDLILHNSSVLIDKEPQKQMFLPEVFCSYHSVTFVSLLFVLELPPSKASLTK